MNFEEVRNFWARVLGIRGPQWMIIVALQKLDPKATSEVLPWQRPQMSSGQNAKNSR
jgi:hypothetical protein